MVTNTLFWPGALTRQLAIIVAVSIPPSTRKKGEGMCGRSSFLSAQLFLLSQYLKFKLMAITQAITVLVMVSRGR